jgi:hypothetical protein
MKHKFSYGSRKLNKSNVAPKATKTMQRGTLNHFMTVLHEHGWPRMRHHFGPACCVSATQTVLRVLNEIGIHQARALPVKASIWNTEQYARAKSHTSPPEGEHVLEFIDILISNERIGDIHLTQAEPHPGHLVAAIPIRSRSQVFLIDATIAQANAEDEHIHMPPVVMVAAPNGFLDGSEPIHFEVNGCGVRYQANLENDLYLFSPAWSDPSVTDDAVKDFLQLIG